MSRRLTVRGLYFLGLVVGLGALIGRLMVPAAGAALAVRFKSACVLKSGAALS